jgi:trimethylamine:corrinoid methyltransferase-like protein
LRIEEFLKMIRLTETRASIQPIKSKLKISILDDDEIRGINQTARDILEVIGIMIPSQKALGIFVDAGASVDFDKKIVRIPAQLVADSLKTAPRRHTLCGRRPELDADIGDDEGTYFYCSGEAPIQWTADHSLQFVRWQPVEVGQLASGD